MSLLKEKLEVEIGEAELRAQKTFIRLPIWMRLVTAIFFIALIPSYSVSKNLTASYWQKTLAAFTETGKASFSEAKPPRVSNIIVTSSGKNTYAAAAVIVNDNLDLSATSVPYTFEFLNINQQKLLPLEGQVSGTAFLLPNEKHYVVVTKIITSEPVTNADLILGKDLSWQKKFQAPVVKLVTDVSKSYPQISPLAFVVEGTVQNESSYHIKQVQLIFLVHDKNNNVVALSQRSEYDLLPHERRSYKQLWPNLYIEAGDVTVIAQTNSTDNKNLILPAPVSTSASDLKR